MSKMTCAGHTAKISFDEAQGVFVGTVVGQIGLVFSGTNVEQLRREFKRLLDVKNAVPSPKKTIDLQATKKRNEQLRAKTLKHFAAAAAATSQLSLVNSKSVVPKCPHCKEAVTQLVWVGMGGLINENRLLVCPKCHSILGYGLTNYF
jgi:predicted HicB family RNase H-like nuclease